MIPLSDMNYRASAPVVTFGIIAANVAVFVYELSLGQGLPQLIDLYGTVPAEITSGRGIPAAAPHPIYLAILTSMFLHASLLHIGGNMLYFWVFGDNVEDAMGHLPFLAFYLLCGVAASVAQIAIDPGSTVPSIGASGAIAGILAAYLVLYPGQPVRTLIFFGFVWITNVSAFILIGFWFVAQFVNGLAVVSPGIRSTRTDNVAHWAHIGGFVFGLIFVRLFAMRRPRQFRW